MPLDGIDPAAETPERIRRNWGAITKGAAGLYQPTAAPLTNSGGTLGIALSASGGLAVASNALTIKLAANSGLQLAPGGLSLDVLTTKGDLLSFGTAFVRVPVGADGLALVADHTQPTGIKWAAAGASSPLTTKGDLWGFSTVDTRIPVGPSGTVLTSNPGSINGVAWGSPTTIEDLAGNYSLDVTSGGRLQLSNLASSAIMFDFDIVTGAYTFYDPSSNTLLQITASTVNVQTTHFNVGLANNVSQVGINQSPAGNEALAVTPTSVGADIQKWYNFAGTVVAVHTNSYYIGSLGFGMGNPSNTVSYLDVLGGVFGPSVYIPSSFVLGNGFGFDSVGAGGSGDVTMMIGAGAAQASNLLDIQDSTGTSQWFLSPVFVPTWVPRTLIGSPADGSMEYDGSFLYYTVGTTRRNIDGQVAHATVAAQTAVGNVTTYTTPAADGTYEIGGYVTITAVTLKTINLEVTYTDESNTARTQIFTPQGLTSGTLAATGQYAFPPLVIRVKASTTITVKTTQIVAGTSITFNAGAFITFKY